MNRIAPFSLALLLCALPLLAACRPVMPEAAAAPPQEIMVLAGAGQDTVSINAFFPASVQVRVGDTVTWRINSNEPHTASFLSGEALPPDPVPVPNGGPTDVMLNPVGAFSTRAPDAPVEQYDGTGYRNSGLLSDGTVVPPLGSYSLTFDTPGVYEYICLLHPSTMKGEIMVEPAGAAVPSQAEVDAQAQAEMEPLLAMAEETRAAATDPQMVRQEPGPNGTSFWYVPAGMAGLDPRVEIYDFFPKDLTIQPGDTVIWTSTFFHQVIFYPGMPVPEFILPQPQDAGPPLLVLNPLVVFPSKPAGEFDGTAPFSSGLVGLPAGALPGGTTFAMTFSTPGSFEYVCATHRPLGMTGIVNVIAQ